MLYTYNRKDWKSKATKEEFGRNLFYRIHARRSSSLNKVPHEKIPVLITCHYTNPERNSNFKADYTEIACNRNGQNSGE